jgi:hypothetical protein
MFQTYASYDPLSISLSQKFPMALTSEEGDLMAYHLLELPDAQIM